MDNCEKCGKEIYNCDKIDEGYVDWCDCKTIVILKERMPLFFKGNPTWYDKGDEFEVVECSFKKIVGLCYKLKYAGCIFDGWIVAKNFITKFV